MSSFQWFGYAFGIAFIGGFVSLLMLDALVAFGIRRANRLKQESASRPCRFHESHGFEFSATCPQCTKPTDGGRDGE